MSQTESRSQSRHDEVQPRFDIILAHLRFLVAYRLIVQSADCGTENVTLPGKKTMPSTRAPLSLAVAEDGYRIDETLGVGD